MHISYEFSDGKEARCMLKNALEASCDLLRRIDGSHSIFIMRKQLLSSIIIHSSCASTVGFDAARSRENFLHVFSSISNHVFVANVFIKSYRKSKRGVDSFFAHVSLLDSEMHFVFTLIYCVMLHFSYVFFSTVSFLHSL